MIIFLRFKIIFIKIIKLIKALCILILIPRILYHLLIRTSNQLPRIKNTTFKSGTFMGILNDTLYLQLKNKKEYESHFVELANLICKKNYNVIDLGANIGFHTVILSKLVSNGKVFSFEPQSLAFSILQNNILINKCNNVLSQKFAIGKENNKVCSMDSYSYEEKEINTGFLRVSNSNLSVGDLCIEKKLDSLNLPKIHFMKIDVQGSEINVLMGAKILLKKFLPILFIEIEEIHLKAKQGSSKELIKLILSYNYILFRIRKT